MAFVHNPDRGAADLVILAAQDFTGEPVARVHLPARIPLGFHGSWIPDQLRSTPPHADAPPRQKREGAAPSPVSPASFVVSRRQTPRAMESA